MSDESPRQTAKEDDVPSPELVKAVAVALLLREHEGLGRFGRIAYAAPSWDPPFAVEDE